MSEFCRTQKMLEALLRNNRVKLQLRNKTITLIHDNVLILTYAYFAQQFNNDWKVTFGFLVRGLKKM